MSVEGFKKFFEQATGNQPYEWQVDVAKQILEMDRGILSVTAETGSGKTEAVVIPSLYRGRQVIVVEPYRALIEDMVDRFTSMLSRLSKHVDAPYTLGVDYGGEHFVEECMDGSYREVKTRKPFGTDILLTTMDEMLYRLLSVGPERKASLYSVLVRLGTPIVFFDEAHSYSTEAANPLVTLVNEAVSMALYTPVVIASATLPSSFKEHLKLLVERNGLPFKEYEAPKRERKTGKAIVHVKIEEKGADAMASHTLRLAEKGFKTILVRTIVPETAYSVYSRLVERLKGKYSVGILHGRMPIKDRAKVFRALKQDVENGENVVFVSTTVIEAGVNLDFDAGVLELTPYRSLEQTLGRVNRYYMKPNTEVVLVGTDENTWTLLAPKSYLEELQTRLAKFSKGSGKEQWELLRATVLQSLDEKYTKNLLSTKSLIDIYDTPYSRLLTVSFYSLFHLEGTMLEYLVALSKSEYETRGSLDIVVNVEGEPGNLIRVPRSIVEKLREKGVEIEDGGTLKPSILIPHNYVTRSGEPVEARGLIIS